MSFKLSKGVAVSVAGLVVVAGVLASVKVTSNKMADEFEPATRLVAEEYLNFATLQRVDYEKGFLFSSAKTVWTLNSEDSAEEKIELQHEITNLPLFTSVKSIYKSGEQSGKNSLKFGLPKGSNLLVVETRIGPGSRTRSDITLADVTFVEEGVTYSSQGASAHFATKGALFVLAGGVERLEMKEAKEGIDASDVTFSIEGDSSDLIDATINFSVGEFLGNFAGGKQVSRGVFFKAGSVVKDDSVSFTYALGMDEILFSNDAVNISANSPIFDVAIKVDETLAKALSDPKYDSETIFNAALNAQPEFIINEFASSYNLNGETGIFKMDGAVTMDVPADMMPYVLQAPVMVTQYIKGSLNLDADKSLFALVSGLVGVDLTAFLKASELDPKRNGFVTIGTEAGVFSLNGIPLQ